MSVAIKKALKNLYKSKIRNRDYIPERHVVNILQNSPIESATFIYFGALVMQDGSEEKIPNHLIISPLTLKTYQPITVAIKLDRNKDRYILEIPFPNAQEDRRCEYVLTRDTYESTWILTDLSTRNYVSPDLLYLKQMKYEKQKYYEYKKQFLDYIDGEYSLNDKRFKFDWIEEYYNSPTYKKGE